MSKWSNLKGGWAVSRNSCMSRTHLKVPPDAFLLVRELLQAKTLQRRRSSILPADLREVPVFRRPPSHAASRCRKTPTAGSLLLRECCTSAAIKGRRSQSSTSDLASSDEINSLQPLSRPPATSPPLSQTSSAGSSSFLPFNCFPATNRGCTAGPSSFTGKSPPPWCYARCRKLLGPRLVSFISLSRQPFFRVCCGTFPAS